MKLKDLSPDPVAFNKLVRENIKSFPGILKQLRVTETYALDILRERIGGKNIVLFDSLTNSEKARSRGDLKGSYVETVGHQVKVSWEDMSSESVLVTDVLKRGIEKAAEAFKGTFSVDTPAAIEARCMATYTEAQPSIYLDMIFHIKVPEDAKSKEEKENENEDGH
jgi:hypothetical protein